MIYEKLSLDKIDQYLKELQAIRDYENVKQQRDQAIRECNELKEKILPIIENIIDVLGSPEPHIFSQDALDVAGERIIEKIDKIIKNEVEKRINDYFIRRVEIESKQRADEKFNQMKYTEWPKYFRDNIEPKVRELETKIKANTFSLLKGPWTIECDSCGKRQPVEISSQGIQSLLINGFIDLKCDRISILLPESPITNLMLNPHNTRIQLSKMIQDYLK